VELAYKNPHRIAHKNKRVREVEGSDVGEKYHEIESNYR
jgi:hypothetical protein